MNQPEKIHFCAVGQRPIQQNQLKFDDQWWDSQNYLINSEQRFRSHTTVSGNPISKTLGFAICFFFSILRSSHLTYQIVYYQHTIFNVSFLKNTMKIKSPNLNQIGILFRLLNFITFTTTYISQKYNSVSQQLLYLQMWKPHTVLH